MRGNRTTGGVWVTLLAAFCLWATTAGAACILTVPQHYQVMDQWCWAATSQSVLEFYGTVLSQAEIAAYGTDGANIPNYICGTSSSPTRRGVNMILDHFAGIVTTWGQSALSQSDLGSDVCANLPPVILWTWDSGGGHIAAIRGVDGDTVHLMDPWYGATVNTYAWVCRGSSHTWAETLRIAADPSPRVTVNQAGIQTDPTGASPINFTVVFSKEVTDFASGAVTLGGSAGGTLTGTVSGSGTTYNVAVNGMTSDGTVTASLAAGVAHDAFGHPSAASTSTDNTVTYDTSPPTVTIDQAATQADPACASPIVFTVVFSKTVTDFATGDVTVGGTAPGTLTTTVTGSGTTYTVEVSGVTGDGTITASLAAGVAHDTEGRPSAASSSTDNTVTYDASPLTVTVNQAATQADPTNDNPINFTVVFSRPVTDFAAGDVTISGTATGTQTATVSGSGTTYNVAVNGTTGAYGTVLVDLAASVAHDGCGNPNAASTSTDNTVIHDWSSPTVTINKTDPGNSCDTTAGPIPFTVVFSEAVTDFSAADVTVSATTPGTETVTVSGSGTTYSVEVDGMTGSGIVTVRLKADVAHDAAGNGNLASTYTGYSVSYDPFPPTVTINQKSTQADPACTAPIAFTVVFSEAAYGLTGSDVTLGGSAPGTKTATVSGSGTTYTVSVSGMTGDGTVTASLAANVADDGCDNPCSASTSTDNTVTYDGTPPTVTITSTAPNPTNSSPIPVTITFSEAMTGFVVADLTVGNGSAGSFAGGPTVYTANITPAGQGAVTVDIAAGLATDAAGNGNTAAGRLSRTYDTVAPTVTINQTAGQADPTGATPISFTVVFSEAVTDFDSGDVTVAGTATGPRTVAVTGSGTTYTVTISAITGEGTVRASLAAGVAHDAGGYPSAASTSTDNTVTYDSTSPAVVLSSTAPEPTKTKPIPLTITFSTPVSGFALADITVGNGTAGTFAGGPTVYTAKITPAGQGQITVDIAAGVAIDTAGNGNTAATQLVRTYDTLPPTVVDVSANTADGAYGTGAVLAITVSFSEAVIVTGTPQLTLAADGDAIIHYTSGSGTPTLVFLYSVTSGQTSADLDYVGTNALALNGGTLRDAAANNAALALPTPGAAHSLSANKTLVIDTTPPTVTLNQAAAQPDPTNAPPIAFTVVFNETVADFGAEDVTLGGSAPGTLIVAVTGSGTTYTVEVSGMDGDGTVTASLAAGVAHDLAGNASAAATSTDSSVAYDITPPTVTLSSTAPELTNTSPIPLTITCSEPVVGLTLSDLGVGNGSPASLSAGPTVYSATVTPAGQGDVTVDLAAGAATDAAGNDSTAATRLSRTYDNLPPTVTEVSASSADGAYGAGAILELTLAFSEAVLVTGAPQLALETGASDALASYSGGSGSTTLTFQYTVAAGHASVDLDYVGIDALALNGGSLRDAATNHAALTLPAPGAAHSLSANRALVIDTIPPTVTLNQAAAQPDPTRAAPIAFTVVFSEAVTDFTADDVTSGGTAPGARTATVTGSGTTYTVEISGMTGDGTITASLATGVAHDTVGNASAAASGSDTTVTYDTTAPTVTLNQAASQSDPTSAAPITFIVIFSEPVADFASADVTLGGTAPGTKAATVTGSGTAYTVEVSGMTGNGTVTASLAAGVAHDLAGNASAASTTSDDTVTYDVSALTVTLNQAATQPDPARVAPITFTAVFSAAVADFSSGDVTLGGTAPGTKTATVTGSGTTYAITVSGMTGSGTVTARLAAGIAHDLADNASAASTSSDDTVTYDTVAPTVTLNQAAGQPDPARLTPIRFTAVFSEPVAGFAATAVTLGGTAPGTKTVTLTGSATTYTVEISGMTGNGTVTASLAAAVAHDAAGNASAAATTTDNTVTYDQTRPTVVLASPAPEPTNASPIPLTITCSEPVAGLTLGDIAVGNGSAASLSGGPSLYSASITPAGPGLVTVDLAAGAATDAAGNLNTAAAPLSRTYDNLPPTVVDVTASTADGAYTTGAGLDIRVVFSEPVIVTGTPLLTLETGPADALVGYSSGSGTATLVFRYTVSAGHRSADLDYAGSAALSPNGGTLRDAAANHAVLTLPMPGVPHSLGANTALIIDTTAPTVVCNQAPGQADPARAAPISLSVIFSEPVTDFAAGDVTIGGNAPGTKTAIVTGSGTTYTVAISGMTGNGTVTATLAGGVAHDAAGNASAAATTTDNTVTYDVTPPTVTLNQTAGQADPARLAPVSFTVVFSESVTDFASSAVTVGGSAPGTRTATVTGSGTTYTVAITGMTGDGTVTASLAAAVAHDAAGNASAASTSTDNTVTYDPTPPTAAITSTAPEPTNASPIPVTITFSEPVSGLTLVDLVVASGSAAVLNGGPTVYSTSVTPTGQGAVAVSLAVGAATDAAGNASTAAALVRVYDSVAPTLTGLTDDALPARIKTWTWGSSEPLSRFRYLIDASPGSVPTGTYDAVASATQTAGDGTCYLHVQAQDAAGNESAVVTVHALLDNTAPLLTGLVDDPGPRRAKTWTWAGSDSDGALQYRHALDQAPDGTPGGAYGDVTTATKDAAEGTWYLHVQARDRAGNESAVATVAVLLDNTGPTVTGLAAADVPTRSQTWTWSSSEALSCFRHRVDTNPGGAPTGAYGSATTATQPAGDGTYYLHVQAQDAAGNDSAVLTVHALLDNTAPTVTGLTADPGPRRAKTWTWAGSDADSVLLFRAAIDQAPDGTPDGAYSDVTTASKDAAEGTWYLHVQARDRAGNESAVATVAVLLDNTGPSITGLADDEVPRRSKTWTWSSGEAQTRFRALIDTTPGSAPTGAYGSVTTATQPAGDGTYYLHVQAQDAAGNESAVVTVHALLDNTAPLVSGLFDDPGPCRAKTWTWAGSDADSVLQYRHALDQAPDGTPDGAYSDGTTATKDAAEGTWYLHVQARDRAGNESAVATVSVLLDNTGPNVTGLTDDDVPAPSQTWTWGSSDAVSRFRGCIDTNPGGAPTGAYDSVTTATQPAGDGTYYLHVQAQDAAGNESAVVTVHALLDNTAPLLTGLLDDPGPSRAKTWTWAGSDADSVLVFRAVIDQAPGGRPGGAYGNLTSATKDGAEGTWYLHVQARDRAGNESAVATVAALLDNTGPTVTGLADDEVPVRSKTWTWGSSEALSRFRYRVDTTPDSAPTGVYGTVTTATQPAGDGTYYLHVQAQDAAGCESSIVTIRALLDNTAPRVTGLLDDPGPVQAKTWTWGGSDADRVLVFRALIDQAPDGTPDGAYSDVTTATKDGAEGTWYLHVQARDRAGNESAVATATVLLDNAAPAITGLSDDPAPTRSKTWTWGGSKSVTRFRHLVDTRPDGAPTGPYSTVTTATQAAGDGVYYLHVQATDAADNESAVLTVQALLDNTPPSPPNVGGMALCHSATPTWSWTRGGAGAGAFRCALDDPSLLASTAETTQTTFTPAGALAEGPRALYVQERDAAGNWSTPGLATTVVDAECTATFVAGEHGCLRGGSAYQLLPYGASTTPVAAVADFAYVFNGWSDARTSNPRTDTNVTADLHLTAAFRPANPASPSGDFLARVTTADDAARRLWDLTGDYATTVAGSPLLLRMVHDVTGRLTGTALCTFANTTLVTMPIRGSVKGSAGSVRLTGAMSGTDPAGTVTIALTLSLLVDPANLLLAGRLTGTLRANGTTHPVNQYLALPIPAPMDGTWALQLALDQAGKAVGGTALLTLANGTDGAFVVQGRTRGTNVALNLAAGPAGRALEAATTIAPLEGGWALLQTFSVRAYGQTISW